MEILITKSKRVLDTYAHENTKVLLTSFFQRELPIFAQKKRVFCCQKLFVVLFLKISSVEKKSKGHLKKTKLKNEKALNLARTRKNVFLLFPSVYKKNLTQKKKRKKLEVALECKSRLYFTFSLHHVTQKPISLEYISKTQKITIKI